MRDRDRNTLSLQAERQGLETRSAEEAATQDAGQAQKTGSEQAKGSGFRNVGPDYSGFGIGSDVGDEIRSIARSPMLAVSASSDRIERKTVDDGSDR